MFRFGSDGGACGKGWYVDDEWKDITMIVDPAENTVTGATLGLPDCL